MTECSIGSKYLREAISAENESFLRTKELNRVLLEDILKIPAQKTADKEHLKKAKPLLAEIQKLLADKEKEDGVYERNYYDFRDELVVERSNLLAPRSALDGYIEEATRQYFVHTLNITHEKPVFEFSENQSFNFRLDDMLKEESLSDSMEIKHTVDWALIGKALAAREIQKLTNRRGPKKKRADDVKTSMLDRKRLEFIRGVESELLDIEDDLEVEEYTYLTDAEVISAYQAMLREFRRKNDNTFDDLEMHIKLGSMGIEAACNSISRARNSEDI